MTPWEIERVLRPLADDIGPALDPDSALRTPLELFPVPHLELLQLLNGMTVYHGAFRLFGVREEPFLDLLTWNAWDTWRFAWGEQVDPYMIFGETAWGDQYAYRRGESGAMGEEVYFLEGTLLRSEVIAGSFEEFLVDEFLRNAERPYDEITLEVVRRRRAVASNKHWVYVPSVALGGPESIENVVEMPAVTAMTFAGDIATALQGSSSGASPMAVVPWTDDRSRSRLRVVFG